MSHVLIVDDEADIRDSLGEILAEDGYTVTTTATGVEAMVLLRDATYDAVLLDIWLPDRDGMDVLQDIRQLESEIRPEVIIISGHGTIESAVRATKLGAFDFLEKAALAGAHAHPAEERDRSAPPACGERGVEAPALAACAHLRRERAHQGAAPADQADGADQWARADFRRVRLGQGDHRARNLRARACVAKVSSSS